MMRYVTFAAPGGPEVLKLSEMPVPQPRSGEVLIAVDAAGVTHADLMQREGTYPPPQGASPILGLEVAGTVAGVGDAGSRWRKGDRVCALTNGGGYAEYVTVAQGQVLPVPQGWSTIEAATLPENFFTVYDNLFTRARLSAGETVLVHGGSSGIGTTAIMLAKAFGARSYATAGNADKCAAAVRLGATAAIDYRTSDFVAEVNRLTAGRGVDVVVDIIGGDYIARDLQCLALDGRIACIASQHGRHVALDLAPMFARRATIAASSLRPRTAAQKAAVAAQLEQHVWPLLPQRDPIVPVIDSIYAFESAADAHARMESSAHIGKIILAP